MPVQLMRFLPLIALGALSCGGHNPTQVWLGLNGSERMVQLLAYDPGKF